MSNFTVDQIRIGEKEIDRITDEEGVHWYPLKAFIRKILCKSDKNATFRDSTISRYLKVFEYEPQKRGGYRPIKKWCINENGVKFLLRNMKVVNRGKKELYRSREKGFFEACLYFKVRTPDELDPLYINVPPKLTDYDIWSVVCLENDFRVRSNSRWKKCAECNYYYPDSTRYFGSDKKKNKKCLQCQGKQFKCANYILQYIYDNGGLDLIYKIYEGKDEDIVRELKNFINKGVNGE